jgi:ABC-2 type transport system permease protein
MTFRHAFEATLLEIVRTRDLLSVAVVSVLFYAFYYPAPYAHQVVERLPIVLVDADRSAVSREILRTLEAAHTVAVVADVPDLAAARRIVRNRQADGILLLPRGLSADVAAGRPGTGIAVWVNGAYLLRAQAIGKSMAGAVAVTVAKRLPPGLSQLGDAVPPVSTHALYNTTEGYRDYIFPAVANIILQQTLLFAVARLVAERRRSGRWGARGKRALFFGTWAACTTIGTLAALLYFGLVFWLQDIPHGGNLAGVVLIAPLFAATVAALGMLMGTLVRSGDDALKLLIPTSIPFVFLSGFAWPLVAMPAWVRGVAWMIPVTPAMHIFVPMNQMGATMVEVRDAIVMLLLQLGVFALLSFLMLRRGKSSTN